MIFCIWVEVVLCVHLTIAVSDYRFWKRDSSSRYCPNYKTDKVKRPNIILILSDDQGWNDVGFHNSSVLTPNIDRLANEGVKLGNSYVQPLCTPSRAAILSGKYPYRTGLQWLAARTHQAKFLPRNVTILPEKLKEVGYSTHMIGKWHLGHCSYDLLPTYRGFDSFLGLLRSHGDFYTRTMESGYDFWKNDQVYYPPEGSYNTDVFTDRAVELVESHDQDLSPLFLYLAYTSPHFPLQVQQRFENMYPNEVDPTRKTYLGMISSLDEAVGRVVKALEEKQFLENTVIIFISDNGGDNDFGASNYPLRGDKGDLWEGGTKSVGFVYSRTLLDRKGCKHQGLIHAVDWFPSILDIAKHPDVDDIVDIDGVSQWRSIKTCRGSTRTEFVYNIDDDVSKSSAIRVGQYKLIVGDPRVYVGDASSHIALVPADRNSTDIQLFDLKSDPFEQYNIALDMLDKVQMMMEKLNDYRKDSIPAQNKPAESPDITQPNGVLTLGWC